MFTDDTGCIHGNRAQGWSCAVLSCLALGLGGEAVLCYVVPCCAVQFRIKAASRAILELERLQQPIVTAEVCSPLSWVPKLYVHKTSDATGSMYELLLHSAASVIQ